MQLFQNQRVKITLRWFLIIFYLIAGINHFVHPQFYLPLIPSYLPKPEMINWVSGVAEVLLAIGVILPRYRRIAVFLIILMLIAFIPSHVFFIQQGACVGHSSLCTPMWVAWLRLFPIHPLLMVWAWYVK
ncbi:MauE/DoxX family redox-associated membrane protein [Flammeovirga sp. EKP202]|uniref:DoxX family protein n=1 Tax=Flammeovirga sp. EKP202 TaxID=2770592 RepID=UPI00165FEEE0|nr:MauE/DoxX family redox-associated membrane protein [Flammeovirga sp. EKP202]MBD0401817.1 DoxX family membrane protein [Flammeovirga sp. EKP202]